jgi:hypothetical protein
MNRPLAEIVLDEARAFRARQTTEGRFLARQLERLAQLIRFSGAPTPREYEDRFEVFEADLLHAEYERGQRDAAAKEYCPR